LARASEPSKEDFMNRKMMALVGVVAVAWAAAVTAREPTPPPEPAQEIQESRTIEGEVVEVSAQSLTIRTTDGRRMTFSVDRDLTTGVEPITVGSRVRVEYRGDELFEVVDVRLLADLDEPDVDVPDVEPDPQVAPAAAQTERDELPGTASPLPLLLVTGLALLGSGLALSARRV
jgi:hypothetical protein